MNELRILIARLHWPSTSCRWWAMQELAERLGEVLTKAETEAALLHLLRSRKLEAEVVEVITIFWMAIQEHAYVPCTELVEVIPKASFLSEMLVKDSGLAATMNFMNLQVAPADFEIPDDFERIQGSDNPRIFHTLICTFEEKTKLPFLKQMAFEWFENKNEYPDAPYQGDASHFSVPLGVGFIVQCSARAALRSISAYLRTLAIGVHFWGLSRKLADNYSLLALPVHPTFAFLKPRSPEWFPPHRQLEGGSEEVEAVIREIISELERATINGELIAFSSPLRVSMNKIIEISLVRWNQAQGSTVPDTDLANHHQSFWRSGQYLASRYVDSLNSSTFLSPLPIDELIDEDSKAWPLASLLGLDRMGYLQHDLYPSRLYFPTMPDAQELQIKPCGGQVEVSCQEQVVADFRYWNVGWGPARPFQLEGNCGTALVSRGKAYRSCSKLEDGALRSFYLWQVRTLRREGSHSRFEEELNAGVLFV